MIKTFQLIHDINQQVQRLYSPNILPPPAAMGYKKANTQITHTFQLTHDNYQHIQKLYSQYSASTSRYGLQEMNTQIINTFQ